MQLQRYSGRRSSKGRHLHNYLHPAEVMAMLKTLEPTPTDTRAELRRKERDLVLLLTLWATGGRISEVLDLRPYDIIPPDRIRLPTRKSKSEPSRIIVVPPQAIAYLTSYVAKLRLYQLDYVFQGQDGRLSTRRSRIIVQQAAAEAGVFREKGGKMIPAWPHLLRHGAGMHWVKATNGNVLYVQRQLGHSDLASTMEYILMEDTQTRELGAGVSLF